MGVDEGAVQVGRSAIGRRERKKHELHERLRRAASELFAEKGYEATTVEEIAERADVAKGTFFNYFPRKDALLEALAEEMNEALEAELGPMERWGGTAREQLCRFFFAIASYIERDRELSKVMVIENMRNYWLRSHEDEAERRFRQTVERTLEGARSRREIAPEVDVEVAARLIEAAYVTTLVEWLRAAAPGSAFRTELTSKLEIIFRGLGAGRPAGGEEGA